MRADRLLNILLHLQAKGRTTAKELSKKLEISERTVHRDMEALCSAGIPIYAERGIGGGWALSEGYRTNLTGFKKEEVISLLLVHSSRVLEDLGKKKDFDSAFVKLLAALPPAYRKDAETVRQRIHIDGAGWNRAIRELPLLPVLQDAVWEERKLKIIYEKEGKREPRTIEPYGLVAMDTTWYVVAKRGREMRVYRISRIKEAEMISDRFERPKKFDLAKYWEEWVSEFKSRVPKYIVTLRVTESEGQRIKSLPYVRFKELRTLDGGFAEIDIDMETREWALSHVMHFGESIYVQEPGELREAIIQRAKDILEMYRS
ncbi:YafY family transcriptional regulator [Leptospira langatensis]|uniref:YafY family transcriptional regulator n=1 Tax=Leptospira langatensis TaxID=2484983 RepID=A0A5F1ZTU8_9LEPT|nr:YafY family protein [Leptospira langatensis]TGK03210.1 YafY family transcriptional regulator [Leptospira langatensis]TGL40272.1 YafY family transcriptional regulator [Leptospira langatensis]